MACIPETLVSVCAQNYASQKAPRSSRCRARRVTLQLDSRLNFGVKLLVFCLWHFLPSHISIFNSETNTTDATFHIPTFFSFSEKKNVRCSVIDKKKIFNLQDYHWISA